MTMHAPIAAATPLDPIRAFLPDISDDEHEQRRRISVARNCAAFKVTQTESSSARTLCWMVSETATAWLYAPASLAELANVAVYLRRLLTLADQAEEIGA